MDDFAPFESPKLLVEGATASLAELKSGCERFLRDCSYKTIRYREPNSGDHVVKLRFHHRIPPPLRLSASRILNDLRHALDQAVCDAAIVLGRANAKGIYFPFGRTKDDLARQIAEKCKKVHPDLVAFIKTLEPHSEGGRLLYGLAKLSGPNKHQRVIRISLDHTGLTLDETFRLLSPTRRSARFRLINGTIFVMNSSS